MGQIESTTPESVDFSLNLAKYRGQENVKIVSSMISKLPPSFTIDLASCISLDLSQNSISSLPKEIKNLKNLQHLNLSGNVITDCKSLLKCEKLKTLKLNNCFLSKIPELPKTIKKLKLKNNNLPEEIKFSTKNFPNLEEINLSCNSKLVKVLFDNDNKINAIKLNQVFGPLSLKSLFNLKNLKFLSVSKSKVAPSDEKIDALHFPNLEKLICSFSTWKISADSLQKLNNLKYLKLSIDEGKENYFNDATFKSLESLEIFTRSRFASDKIWMIANLADEKINFHELLPNLNEKQLREMQMDHEIRQPISLSSFPYLKEFQINIEHIYNIIMNKKDDLWNISTSMMNRKEIEGPFEINQDFNSSNFKKVLTPLYGNYGQVYIVPLVFSNCYENIRNEIHSFSIGNDNVIFIDLENQVKNYLSVSGEIRIEKILNPKTFISFSTNSFVLTERGEFYYFNSSEPKLCSNLPLIEDVFPHSNDGAFIKSENEIKELKVFCDSFYQFPTKVTSIVRNKIDSFSNVENIKEIKVAHMQRPRVNMPNKIIFVVYYDGNLLCYKEEKSVINLMNSDIFSQFHILDVQVGKYCVYFFCDSGIFRINKKKLAKDNITKNSLIFDKSCEKLFNITITMKSARK